MSQRFVPDRNTVTFGPAKTNDKNLERELDDLDYKASKGGTTTTVTEGGTILVPGTYVVKVGLPPGVPYLYVIGNLLEGYPVDTTLTGELANVQIVQDVSGAFGLGTDTVIGFTPTDDLIAYSIPAQPVIADYPSTGPIYAVSAGGVVGVLRSGDFRVGTPTGWVTITPPSGYAITSVGPDETNTTFIVTMLPDPTPTGFSLIAEVDNTGAVLGTISVPFVDERRVSGGGYGVTQNGWTIQPCNIANSNNVGPLRFRRSTMNPADPWVSVPLVGNFDPGYKRMSIGPTGVAWFCNAGTSVIATTVYRLNMNNATIQQFPDVFFDPTATVRANPLCVTYVSDSVGFVGGNYQNVPGPFNDSTPLLLMLAVAPDGSTTLNFEEFPDPALICGVTRGIVSAVQVDGTTVFHMWNFGGTPGDNNPGADYSLLYGTA